MANEQSKSHSVRILPRVTLGGLPGGENGVEMWEEPTRVVAHLHMGSWKSDSFKRKARLLMDEGNAMVLLQAPSKVELQQRLYPVSTNSQPPFTVLTYLKGLNRVQVVYPSSLTTLHVIFRSCLLLTSSDNQMEIAPSY